MSREIETLPPLAHLGVEVPLSPRTGEPRRPAMITVAAVLCYVAIAAIAFSYGWHWYRAAFTTTYPVSAHLTQWVEPEPGKWVSLFLEFVYAGLAGLAGGAAGVVGFHAWKGRRWTKIGGFVAIGIIGITALLMNKFALIALGIVAVASALLWLPPVRRYFSQWAALDAEAPVRYRRPTQIHYGRLPRFQ